MATEDQSVQTAPIGRIPDAGAPPQTAIPTLNPTDSPYKPLNLPTVEPKQIPLADQQPVQNLGATSKGGGLAYIADQILRGVVKGYDAGQQQKADQYNKKLQAQDQVYNAQAAEVHDIAAAGRAGTFTGPPGPDGKPTFVMSDEFKQARNRAFIAWQAMYQTVGERIPQPKKSAKSKQGQNQPQPTDQTTLVQAVANHQNDPQGATQAIYAAAGKLGPPVFHQIAGFLTPEYVAKQQQAAQTQQTQAQTGEVTAQNDLDYQRALSDYTAALKTGDQSKITTTQTALEELKKARAPESKATPQLINIRNQAGNEAVWDKLDGVPPVGWTLAGTTSPAPPKVGSLGEFLTALYGNNPTPKQEIEGKKLWTPEVQTTGVHTVMVQQGDKIVPIRIETSSTRGPADASAGVPDVRADGTQPSSVTPAAAKPVNPYSNPEDQPADVSYTFNKPWAKPGPYLTVLSPADETKFQKWMKDNPGVVDRNALDDPHSGYDVRGWWLAGEHGDPSAKRVRNAWDGKMHSSDKWKTPYNGTFSNESLYATPDAPRWVGDKLMTADGKLVTDETPKSRGGASKPKTATSGSSQAAPKSAASNSAGVISVGNAVGYRDSPEYKAMVKQATDAKKEYNSAATNLSTMLKVAPEAKKGDGAAQVAIVSAYLKTVVGGQGTGVRITKAEWDAAVKTRTIPEGIAATFSPDGYLTGAAISPQQVDQFMNAVHQKTRALYETKQTTEQAAATQQQSDVPANLQTAPPAAPQSNSIDDEILNLVKH